MATTNSSNVRQGLDALWSDLKKADVDKNDDIDIKGLKVKIDYGYNFDSWTQDPRVTKSAFDPVASSIFSILPIDRSHYTDDRLDVCCSMPPRGEQAILDITRDMCGIVDEWTFFATRLNMMSKYNAIYLSALMEIRPIHEPSPFWLGLDLDGYYLNKRPTAMRSMGSRTFGTIQLYETEISGTNSAFPHFTFLCYQPFNGRDNSILYGELYLLICAMRNRAYQRKVDDEEEQEALYEEQLDEGTCDYPSGVDRYGFEFPDETEFPVLMASFVGPHHGRLFYATMENDTLHIRQSDLYEFRNESVAPLDLFGSILLSRPSGVPAAIPTHSVVLEPELETMKTIPLREKITDP